MRFLGYQNRVGFSKRFNLRVYTYTIVPGSVLRIFKYYLAKSAALQPRKKERIAQLVPSTPPKGYLVVNIPGRGGGSILSPQKKNLCIKENPNRRHKKGENTFKIGNLLIPGIPIPGIKQLVPRRAPFEAPRSASLGSPLLFLPIPSGAVWSRCGTVARP